MPDVVITGLFSLFGAILGAVTSIFVLSRTMKKSLQLEIQKINLQKESELSIRLLDKKEAYFAELLVVLSTVRNVAMDFCDFGYTDETETSLRQSNDAVSLYLNLYEKRNILYVPKQIRHKAAETLHGWKSFCTRETSKWSKGNREDRERDYEHFILEVEHLVEVIKREIGRV
ncbi:MAG: hypothetical protein FWE06_03090 [Oscillospiraceae bacterium]|nr:hypothetical protein [Oscillospiraceae bacterium]